VSLVTDFRHSSSSPCPRLPELEGELQYLLKETESQIRKLPAAPSDDAQGEILLLVSDFARELASYVEGTPDDNGIHQAIRPLNKVFTIEIRGTAQKFSPFVRGRTGPRGQYAGYTHPKFHPSDDEPKVCAGDDDAICVDEVMEMADK